MGDQLSETFPISAPLTPRAEVVDFLLTRRSRPAKTLVPPVPGREALATILAAAARTPDHGKLEPWRFVVLERAALLRLAALARARMAALGRSPEDTAKVQSQFADSHLCVAVIRVPRETVKVPEIEQVLSAGAVCLSLVNAGLASGWGACWLTGPMATDDGFLRDALGCAAGEWVAGFVHLGSETAPPPDRPRPDLARIVTWMAE
jgi:nitroreductase